MRARGHALYDQDGKDVKVPRMGRRFQMIGMPPATTTSAPDV